MGYSLKNNEAVLKTKHKAWAFEKVLATVSYPPLHVVAYNTEGALLILHPVLLFQFENDYSFSMTMSSHQNAGAGSFL